MRSRCACIHTSNADFENMTHPALVILITVPMDYPQMSGAKGGDRAQHGPHMGPTWAQHGSQNGSQNGSKHGSNMDPKLGNGQQTKTLLRHC